MLELPSSEYKPYSLEFESVKDQIEEMLTRAYRYMLWNEMCYGSADGETAPQVKGENSGYFRE